MCSNILATNTWNIDTFDYCRSICSYIRSQSDYHFFPISRLFFIILLSLLFYELVFPPLFSVFFHRNNIRLSAQNFAEGGYHLTSVAYRSRTSLVGCFTYVQKMAYYIFPGKKSQEIFRTSQAYDEIYVDNLMP